jgi:hypothetical protein
LYVFWHGLFAGLAALLAWRFLKPNPAWLFVFTVVLFGVVPDADHLLCWNPVFLYSILPRYLTDGIAFSLRTNVYPCYLHLWVWPTIISALALISRREKLRMYLIAAAIGWGVHLILDGVLVLL